MCGCLPVCISQLQKTGRRTPTRRSYTVCQVHTCARALSLFTVLLILSLNKPFSSSSSCLPPPTRVARSRSEFSSFAVFAMKKPLSSNATGNQVATLDFVPMLPGRKLMKSFCVMHSTYHWQGHASRFCPSRPSRGALSPESLQSGRGCGERS